MNDLAWHLQQLKRRGLRHIDSLIPTVNTSLLTILVEFILWSALGISITMVIVGKYGIVDNVLYSGLRLPVLWNLQLFAEYPQALTAFCSNTLGVAQTCAWIDPEQSLHWTTVISTILLLLFFNGKLLKRGFTAIHSVAYSIMVSFASLVFPFEWIYTTLFDVFHNMPVEHRASLTLYGTWNIAQGKIFDSVIGRNGFIALCLFFAWIVGQDAMNGKLKLHFDRVSGYLALSIVGAFAFWVLLPVIIPSVFNLAVPFKGTNWFPQDIMVWYGQAPWLTNPNAYDIVKEIWVPGCIGANYGLTDNMFTVTQFSICSSISPLYGPIMRVTNEIVKALCTIWVAWTFLPKTLKSTKVN